MGAALTPAPTPGVRRAAAADRPGLYAVALSTADHGRDAAGLVRDPDAPGAVYAGPYLDLEPERCWVACDAAGAVVGYAVGTLDSRAFEAARAARIAPALAEAWPLAACGSAASAFEAAMIRAIHAPWRAPEAVVARAPAHLHANVRADQRGAGLGSALVGAWLADAAASGAEGAHVAVSLRNAEGLRFWRGRGFDAVARSKTGGWAVLARRLAPPRR